MSCNAKNELGTQRDMWQDTTSDCLVTCLLLLSASSASSLIAAVMARIRPADQSQSNKLPQNTATLPPWQGHLLAAAVRKFSILIDSCSDVTHQAGRNPDTRNSIKQGAKGSAALQCVVLTRNQVDLPLQPVSTYGTAAARSSKLLAKSSADQQEP
jgi:hypothetical protein